MSPTHPLPSWNDGATKDAIVSFVRSVTEPGDGFVPADERLATFDNDGTLWCEKPMYIQADFILRKWAAMLEADPALADHQPFKALAEHDREWLGAITQHVPDLVNGVSEAFGGITTQEFSEQVVEFFRTARHPTLNVPYTEVTYRPMVELLAYLEVHGFHVFLCSAGGRDFVREVSQTCYGLERDRVIGTGAPIELTDGALMRTAGVEQPIDDGPGKPVHIWARTGRPPLFAAGNADGDIEMLTLARFALLVHHDDDQREFAYDAGAERALEAARQQGWSVASMRDDFVVVFDDQADAEDGSLEDISIAMS